MLRARLVRAREAGGSLVPDQEIPPPIRLIVASDLPEDARLPEPWSELPLLAHAAAYRGEPLGILVGPSIEPLDAAWRSLVHVDGEAPDPRILAWAPGDLDGEPSERAADEDAGNKAGDSAPDEPDDYQIIEGSYRTEAQAHLSDAPLWAEAVPGPEELTVRVATQWPERTIRAIATATGRSLKVIRLEAVAPGGNRDGALHAAVQLAALAAAAADIVGAPVRLVTSARETLATGGRAPSTIRWLTRYRPSGLILEQEVDVELEVGAYPTWEAETTARVADAVADLYPAGRRSFRLRARTTPLMPLGAWEGVGTSQIAFAREVHVSRLAELMQLDPLEARLRLLDPAASAALEVCETIGREADTRRRWAANELVRKRRDTIVGSTGALKGIGIALATQVSGFVGEQEVGSVAIRLESDRAVIECSLPTPTPRLHLAWRQVVAAGLGLDVDDVIIDSTAGSAGTLAGPRILSRGATLVPRALHSLCQAIQRKRFRAPLPIEARRALKHTLSSKSPAENQRSIGAAAVEVSLMAATLETVVRSVTIVVNAGRILDRGAAEAEIRRGIYHALAWATDDRAPLTEGATSKRELVIARMERHQPAIRVVFVPGDRKDGPTGLGELSLSTVPAALASALSQASGLYLDRIPIRPAALLRMLREEES